MRARRAGGAVPRRRRDHCSSPANGTIRLAAAKSAKRPARRSVTAPRKARQSPMRTSGAKSTKPLLSDRRKPWTWISHSIGETAKAIVSRSSVDARSAAIPARTAAAARNPGFGSTRRSVPRRSAAHQVNQRSSARRSRPLGARRRTPAEARRSPRSRAGERSRVGPMARKPAAKSRSAGLSSPGAKA